MDQSFTQLLPPPATLVSPSQEESCDIVLPPPEESLYTLPRRKTNNMEHGIHVNNSPNQSNQNRENDGKSIDDPSNRSVRFEAEPSPPNSSLSRANTSLNTSIAANPNSKCNKTANERHSESSV